MTVYELGVVWKATFLLLGSVLMMLTSLHVGDAECFPHQSLWQLLVVEAGISKQH